VAPTLASATVGGVTTAGSTNTATSAITVSNGDILVAKCTTEDAGCNPVVATAPGQTFASRASDTTGSYCGMLISTCTVTGSPGTLVVTQAWTGLAGFGLLVVERWTGAQLAGTPATNATKLNAASAGGFSGSITTVAANSVVTWCAGDWSANAPGTVGYRSSATQDGLHDKSPSNYVGYHAYQSAAAAGAQTFGLTTPAASGKWKYLAIEVQDAGGAVAYPFTLLMEQMNHH
jgi:hypothetical protein